MPWLLYICIFFSDFLCFDMSLVLLTVTLRGYLSSIAYCPFFIETYLDTIPDQKFRITLTKCKLSSHNLAIELGRFVNIPRNDRICRCCNLHMIESEYQFLLVRPLYKDLRKIFQELFLPMANAKQRTTCIKPIFCPPPLKLNIKSYFTTLAFDCFIR